MSVFALSLLCSCPFKCFVMSFDVNHNVNIRFAATAKGPSTPEAVATHRLRTSAIGKASHSSLQASETAWLPTRETK